MFRGSININLKKIMGKVYNCLYQLVGEYHYPLFTKMSVSTLLTKLCTFIMDIVHTYGYIVFK